MEQHEGESNLVGEEGLHVHDAHEIADGGSGEGEWMSGVHHDADAHEALTRRAAVVERLEQEEVAPEEQEHRDDQDDAGERAPRTLRIAACRSREQLDRQAQQHERSEEHTSELQSRLHLVCRLLPEKKNRAPRLVIDTRRTSASFSGETTTSSVVSIAPTRRRISM